MLLFNLCLSSLDFELLLSVTLWTSVLSRVRYEVLSVSEIP